MSKDRHNAIRPPSAGLHPGDRDRLRGRPGARRRRLHLGGPSRAGTGVRPSRSAGSPARVDGSPPRSTASRSSRRASGRPPPGSWQEGDDPTPPGRGRLPLALYDGAGTGETGFAYIEHATELDQDAFSVSVQPPGADGRRREDLAPARRPTRACRVDPESRWTTTVRPLLRGLPRVPRGQVGAVLGLDDANASRLSGMALLALAMPPALRPDTQVSVFDDLLPPLAGVSSAAREG